MMDSSPVHRYGTAVPLASGGTAEIYRAYDAALGREVALKFLRFEDPGLQARLLREARALAQLQHPGICEVYRVGEDVGRPYVAMRLIEGQEIDVALADASWRTIVAVMRDAADAVAAAHAAGLVHRDLKPPNILVEQIDGGLRPVVVDFGLVQDRRPGTMLTEAGELLGTPHYMAPEQLRGAPDAIGPPADVWALGITLAQLLFAGRAMPFHAENELDLMRAILRDAPRLPEIGPPALRAVLRRCLAKSPANRYADARALVDDLDRVLDDRPVTRAPTGARALWKMRRLQQRPALAVAALLLLAALALGVVLVFRHRAYLHSVQRYSQLGKDLSWTMRAEHMRPPHDLTPAHARLRDRIAALEAELAALPRRAPARGPLHYAIGEGYRALGDTSAARALWHFERAWAADFRSPDAAYALSATLGQRVVAEWRPLSPDLRLRIASLLERGRQAQTASPDYVEALLALYEERFDDALALAERARRTVPWAYEIDRLIGDVHVAISRAVDSARPGDVDASREAAAAAYARAIERGPSDPASHVRACRLDGFWLGSLVVRPHPEGNDYLARAQTLRTRGLARCAQALQLDPTQADAVAIQGYIERQYAEYLRWQRDEDPTRHLRASLHHLRRAVDMAPHSGRAHAMLSDLYIEYGYVVGDPYTVTPHVAGPRESRPYLDLAVVHGRLAMALAPNVALYPRRLAAVYSRRAWMTMLAERDPAPMARTAHQLHLGARRSDDSASIRTDRARGLFEAWRAVVQHAFAQGRSLQPALRRMRQALEGAGEPLTGTGWDVWLWSLTYQYEAIEAWGTGQDPRAAFDQAARYLQRALQLDPGQMTFLRNEVSVVDARIDAQWVFGGAVDPGWLDQQRARLVQLRDRAADVEIQRSIDHTLWHVTAQARAMVGAAPPVAAPPVAATPATLADLEPSRRAVLAL
ncbi:MAG: serine/threonine-protein kinase, partial [Acidobacteriota bacterium]